jgi:hypothetical protein
MFIQLANLESIYILINRPDGTSFEIQIKDVKPGLKLANGDIVTFSYNIFSRRAIPVDPYVYRIRHDLIWENIAAQSQGNYDFDSTALRNKLVRQWSLQTKSHLHEVNLSHKEYFSPK